MATNDYLPFGIGAGANVLAQADYAALAARLAGFSDGIAEAPELNKVWRQSSFIASVVAQFIADMTGQDVLDDGDNAALLTKLKSALGGRLLNVQTFAAGGTYTPTPGMRFSIVQACGTGGGGGGTVATTASQFASGSGGGSGSNALVLLTAAQIGASQPVTIGAGGTSAAGAAGGNGGTTSLGALLTLPGGLGGSLGAAFPNTTTAVLPGGAGGAIPVTAGTALFLSPGASGITGIVAPSGMISGSGADSPLTGGGGGLPSGGAQAGGFPGTAPGAGGSGSCNIGASPAKSGGLGAGSRMVIWEHS